MDQNDILKHNDEGLFPSPDENEQDFLKRVQYLKNWSKQLKNKDLILKDLPYSLHHQDRLAEAQLVESGKPICEKFGILPDWVPAYYSDKGLPLLTGGMAVQFIEKENEPLKTFFQLKSVFKSKKKWLIYSADELIRHEMCHVARAPLNSTRYEETFAYSTSDSWLRKKIGGALTTPKDNQLILLSLLLWLCATFLPLFFNSIQGWISLLYLPFPTLVILGLVRNVYIRNELKKSATMLKYHFPCDFNKILFRLSDREVLNISKMSVSEIPKWWNSLEGFRGHFLRTAYCPKD